MPDLLPTDAAVRAFCTFRIDHRLYGIETLQVREVSPHLPMTAVPQAPPAVRGLFNLRSRIYLGLDLRPLLGLSPTVCTPESRLIVLKPEVAQDAALLVEQGGDIVHARTDLIEPAGPAEAQDATPLITGVCKLNNELMIVVDLAHISEMMAKLIR